MALTTMWEKLLFIVYRPYIADSFNSMSNFFLVLRNKICDVRFVCTVETNILNGNVTQNWFIKLQCVHVKTEIII